jgi:hypothetical protein
MTETTKTSDMEKNAQNEKGRIGKLKKPHHIVRLSESIQDAFVENAVSGSSFSLRWQG